MTQPAHLDPLSEILRPESQQDEFTRELLKPYYNFVGAKLLDDGTYVGVQYMVSTIAIFIGIGPVTPFKRRYCFKEITDCVKEYQKLQTGDDEPSGWVARRPETPEDIEAKRRPPPMSDGSLSR